VHEAGAVSNCATASLLSSCAAAVFCVAFTRLQSERFGKHFASFGREAAMLADLNHPNVLRFFGVVTESAQDNTVIGIMTEYIRGGSMSSFLR
jgi:serine/threonine protein kinase